MFNDVNFKQMLDQDKEFREYVKEALLAMALVQDNSTDLLKSINAFYNIGSTPKDIAMWIRNYQTINRDNSNSSVSIAECSCDCHMLSGEYQPNHCSLC